MINYQTAECEFDKNFPPNVRYVTCETEAGRSFQVAELYAALYTPRYNISEIVIRRSVLKSFSCARHDVSTQHAFTLNDRN